MKKLLRIIIYIILFIFFYFFLFLTGMPIIYLFIKILVPILELNPEQAADLANNLLEYPVALISLILSILIIRLIRNRLLSRYSLFVNEDKKH